MYIPNDEFTTWMKRLEEMFNQLDKKIERLSKIQNCVGGEQLLDNQDLMMITKMSARTLQRHRKKGTLLYTNGSGKNFYRPKDVKEFIRNNL